MVSGIVGNEHAVRLLCSEPADGVFVPRIQRDMGCVVQEQFLEQAVPDGAFDASVVCMNQDALVGRTAPGESGTRNDPQWAVSPRAISDHGVRRHRHRRWAGRIDGRGFRAPLAARIGPEGCRHGRSREDRRAITASAAHTRDSQPARYARPLGFPVRARARPAVHHPGSHRTWIRGFWRCGNAPRGEPTFPPPSPPPCNSWSKWPTSPRATNTICLSGVVPCNNTP